MQTRRTSALGQSGPLMRSVGLLTKGGGLAQLTDLRTQTAAFVTFNREEDGFLGSADCQVERDSEISVKSG